MLSPRRKLNFKHKGILIAIIAFGVLFVVLVTAAVNSHYDNVAKSSGKRVCADVIGICVEEIVSAYDGIKLIEITYNESGKITSIETDTSSINSIQSQLADMINKKLSDNTVKEKIPLGTLTGNPLFIGKGPQVSLSFTQNNSAAVELVSEFSSAGINQSLHQIYAHITIEVYCFSLMRSTQFAYEFDYLVCETIIVGEIPQKYLSIG